MKRMQKEQDELDKELEVSYDYRIRYENTPLIVIVGRPNVGKSTLFNRFLRKRRAITDSVQGVTRDPIEEQAIVNGLPVRLMDTGGFKLTRSGLQDEDVMDSLVVEKTIEALERADRILLLLDAGHALPEDEEFIQFLRPYWSKLIAAVNKTEGGRLEAEAYNYFKYGFEHLVFISAEHGDNISELGELMTEGLDFSDVREAAAKENTIRLALLGKPNTGKSTLANYLTKSSASIVSDIAGTTRDVVHGNFSYKGMHFVLADTAGIRKKNKVTADIEYYSVLRAIKSLDSTDIVFYLIDAQEGLSEQDKKIIVQASKRGLGIIFLLNKWDMMAQDPKTFQEAERQIKIMFAKMEYVPVLPICAQTGKGVKKALDTALKIFSQLNTKIETSALNLALKDWTTVYPPPAGKTDSFSLKYLVQTSTCPVEFLVFANKPDAVTEGYIRYLQNRIRLDLGFDFIPVTVKVKGSRKRWEDRIR